MSSIGSRANSVTGEAPAAGTAGGGGGGRKGRSRFAGDQSSPRGRMPRPATELPDCLFSDGREGYVAGPSTAILTSASGTIWGGGMGQPPLALGQPSLALGSPVFDPDQTIASPSAVRMEDGGGRGAGISTADEAAAVSTSFTLPGHFHSGSQQQVASVPSGQRGGEQQGAGVKGGSEISSAAAASGRRGSTPLSPDGFLAPPFCGLQQVGLHTTYHKT